MVRRKKPNLMLDMEPHDPSGREVMIKRMVGLVVWLIIAFLIFVILFLVWGMISEALSNRTSGVFSINPLLPLILLVISFLGTFIWNIIITGTFNLIYTDTYYDMWKMFNITLLLNILLFFFFVPLYIIFASSIEQLFMILAMHILLTIFLCYVGMEITTNPNYAASHLVWGARWLMVSIFVFALIFRRVNLDAWTSARILLALPAILWYSCIPLFHAIREKIYCKFYSMWNNFLYVPSLHEVMIDAEDNASVNVDI